MQGLSDEDYLRNYELLRAERDGDRTAFVMLPAMQQWALFRYYLLHEPRSREELLEHRHVITELDPELPGQAADALESMLRILDRLPVYREAMKERPRTKKNATKRVSVFAEVKPDLDPAEFARILVQAGLEQARLEKLAREGKPIPPARTPGRPSRERGTGN
jgi:hypothetical protein